MRRWAALIGVLLVVLVVAVVVRVTRDGDDVGEASDDTATLEAQTFQQDGVPFTFQYPGDFAPVAAAQLPTGYLAILGVSPVNFIDVRLTSEQELSDQAIAHDIGGNLAKPGVTVLGTTTKQVAGTTVTIFQVSDTTSGTLTISTLRFLRAGGKTWELACQSDQSGSTEITAACDGVLDTLKIT